MRLRFAHPAPYQDAVAAFGEATRDDDSLTLQIPSDGSQRELRGVLDRLDATGVETDELTVHTPDLDDVFFALTENATGSSDVGDQRTDAPTTDTPITDVPAA